MYIKGDQAVSSLIPCSLVASTRQRCKRYALFLCLAAVDAQTNVWPTKICISTTTAATTVGGHDLCLGAVDEWLDQHGYRSVWATGYAKTTQAKGWPADASSCVDEALHNTCVAAEGLMSAIDRPQVREGPLFRGHSALLQKKVWTNDRSRRWTGHV